MVYEDNSAVTALATKATVGSKTKYLVVREMWVRQAVERGDIAVRPITSVNQSADLLTMWLPRPAHERHMSDLLGLQE